MTTTPSDAPPGPRHGLVFISLLALITGLITGFGAIFFRGLIAAIHNLFSSARFRCTTTPTYSRPPGRGARSSFSPRYSAAWW
jgi:hypothetical protein